MWFVWVSVVHLHFIRINAQFSDQVWQYRSPNKHQVMGNPSLLPHHQQLYPKISMPVYGFNPNFYPIPFPISVQPSLPLRAFTVPTISLQNLPFQSAWMTKTEQTGPISFDFGKQKSGDFCSIVDWKNQELYDHYRRRKELEETKKRNRVHGIVATMSGKAQAVFAKLSEVLMNPEMKDLDRVNKINDFYKSVDEDIKKEFKDKIRGIGNYN
ncbi:hypothetical protein DINM_005029 [Dirofilaria immitis]|nr:hypothetical protein [Dirofilaria immitis]